MNDNFRSSLLSACVLMLIMMCGCGWMTSAHKSTTDQAAGPTDPNADYVKIKFELHHYESGQEIVDPLPVDQVSDLSKWATTDSVKQLGDSIIGIKEPPYDQNRAIVVEFANQKRSMLISLRRDINNKCPPERPFLVKFIGDPEVGANVDEFCYPLQPGYYDGLHWQELSKGTAYAKIQ